MRESLMVWQSEEHIQEAVGTSTRVSSKKHPPPRLSEIAQVMRLASQVYHFKNH